jgi:hypothetical protein
VKLKNKTGKISVAMFPKSTSSHKMKHKVLTETKLR